MNTIKITLFFLAFTLIGCSDTNEDATDKLETTGILGRWEINNRSYNGLAPLTVVCCEFIEFSVDKNKNDLSGVYTFSSEQTSSTGTFTLDDSNETIALQSDQDETVYDFVLSASQQAFILSYTAQDDTLVSENWVATK